MAEFKDTSFDDETCFNGRKIIIVRVSASERRRDTSTICMSIVVDTFEFSIEFALHFGSAGGQPGMSHETTIVNRNF